MVCFCAQRNKFAAKNDNMGKKTYQMALHVVPVPLSDWTIPETPIAMLN